MKKLATLTGIPQEEIAAKLAEPFPPQAYKGIPGGADLTDISTGFMIERITQVFGLKGVGWNLDFESSNLEMITGEKRVMARLKYAVFWYMLYDEQGTGMKCSIPTSGTNTNSPEYAEEGARTSALGAALKGLCFQLPVYKGELDYHNAGRKAVGKPADKPAGNPSEAPAEPVEKTEKALVKWAKDYYGLEPKDLGAALKAAEITKFDLAQWGAMVQAIKAHKKG